MTDKIKNHISFNFEKHIYKNKNTGDIYTSVTKLISKYTPYFDADKISYFVAKKQGVDQQVILDQWAKKRDKACDKGTLIHKVIEDFLNLNLVTDGYENLLINLEIGFSNLNPTCEDIVYNDTVKIAGQIDMYYIANDLIHIVDWKTNEAIKTVGYNDQKLLGPMDHLPNCEFSKYSLQLSIYALLLSKMLNKKVGSLKIIHIVEDQLNSIKVPFLEAESKLILNNHYLLLDKRL